MNGRIWKILKYLWKEIRMDKFEYKKELLPEPVLEGHQEWIDLYYKAWELAYTNVEYVQKEGWKPMLTCMPGVGITWQWDSCIMTFITNYANGTLNAFNNLDNLYRLRRESDGFMSMAYRIRTEDEAYPGRINPPLMAWAEWEAYLISGDSSRFERVLPALEGCYSFIENNRRRGCGLYWFEDSGSSGMDNSPRSGYPANDLKGSDVCHIDLGCQQALSAKCMSNMFRVLGNAEKAEFYAAEHKRICDLINRFHWSEKAGFYFDFFARGENPDAKVKLINTKTGAAFWALLCGAATGKRKEAMIAHLFNPDEFYTKVPFPALSKDDLNYDCTGGYWLGGVWAPTNFAAIRGLHENGNQDLAREAAIRYLDAVTKVNQDPAFGSIWEVYAPEAYRPATTEAGHFVREDFVGWSGIPPITMLIENIIGLNFNAEENTVIFRLIPGQRGGLRNMKFNGALVSVVCTEYQPRYGESIVEVETDKPIVLEVRTSYRWENVKLEVPAGKHTFKI